MSDTGATLVVRPRGRRRAGLVVASVFTFGLLPLLIVVPLVIEGGALVGVAAGVAVLQVVGLVAAVTNVVCLRWEVRPDQVRVVSPLRRTRAWDRAGLEADVVATPRYHRGIRVGTQRSLQLVSPSSVDSVDISMLGPAGATALVGALRPRARRTARPRRVDGTYEPDLDVVRRFRARRVVWRVLAAITTLATVPLLANDLVFLGIMALVFGPWYLVSSIGLQVGRAHHGPVPGRVRVTNDWVEVALPGDATGERFDLAGLQRISLSGDLTADVVLRLVTAGGARSFSLTGGVDDDARRDAVVPWLDDLRDDLFAAGDQRGVEIHDQQR